MLTSGRRPDLAQSIPEFPFFPQAADNLILGQSGSVTCLADSSVFGHAARRRR